MGIGVHSRGGEHWDVTTSTGRLAIRGGSEWFYVRDERRENKQLAFEHLGFRSLEAAMICVMSTAMAQEAVA